MKGKKESGFVLIAVYLLLFVLITLVISFTSQGINGVKLASRGNRSLQAFYLAEAGVDQGVEWLRSQSTPLFPYQPDWVVLDDGKSFKFEVSHPSEVYKIESTGKVKGLSGGDIEKTLTVFLREDSYARYTYFSNREQYNDGGGMGGGGSSYSDVWFVGGYQGTPGDIINGSVQTNGRFNLWKDPVFGGEVRSVSELIRFYNDGDPLDTSANSNPPKDVPVFASGIDLGAGSVPLPTTALSLRNAASTAGLFLRGETTIVFNANGTINVTNSNAGWSNYNTTIPANGAIFVDNLSGGGGGMGGGGMGGGGMGGGGWGEEGKLYISGTVSGDVSVGASSDIYVTDNVLYSQDPELYPDTAGKLGIIAEKNVIVSSSAPYDLEIDASIMALETSFVVQNYWQGSPKGTLTIYGGAIQDDRGPVGSFDGSTGQKLTGYTKNYQSDSRFAASPPPYNPTTGDYIMTAWQEEEQ